MGADLYFHYQMGPGAAADYAKLQDRAHLLTRQRDAAFQMLKECQYYLEVIPAFPNPAFGDLMKSMKAWLEEVERDVGSQGN